MTTDSQGGKEMSVEGKYIKLADGLEPQSTKKETTYAQSSLLESWTSRNDLAKNKKFALGSQEEVSGGDDMGFFSAVMAAYNNHWVLKTRPEDWWTAISQILATRIDQHADQPAVKAFFVSHERQKGLSVTVGSSSIHGVDYDWFFQAMITQITENINKPEYTGLMKADFSGSTAVDRIVNNIMLMCSFKKYFAYTMVMECGIPGVVMLGSEEDWSNLVGKLAKVEALLKPLEDVLKLGCWFQSSQAVLKNLLETYRGNPDKDWWSRIMDIHRTFGSGGGRNPFISSDQGMLKLTEYF